jgi:TonB family protein
VYVNLIKGENSLTKPGNSFMPCVRLRSFVIISLVLHVIAFLIGNLFPQFRETVTSPQLIEIGDITPLKDPGVRRGTSVASSPEKGPKLEKNGVKPVDKKKQQRDTSNKKDVIGQINESIIEPNYINKGQNEKGEQTNDLATTAAGTRYSNRSGSSKDGKGTGTNGGEGSEFAYPDYKINPKPTYPMIARRNGYAGVVLLRVLILESGKVGKIALEKSSGYEILDKSALDAVKDWIFIPSRRNRVTISSWVTVPIRFELKNR